MFDNLTSRFSSFFDGLKKRTVITEKDLEEILREIRIILLEADVSLAVIKKLLETIKEKALGEKLFNSVTPYNQVIKIINDELVDVLEAGSDKELKTQGFNAYIIMGLQGAGKTTTVAKVAYFLTKKLNKKVLLASVDLNRAAALEQLKQLAEENSIDFFETNTKNVLDIALEAKKYAEENNFDILILDTAGRLNTDDEAILELSKLKKILNPSESLLVLDSNTGQISLKIAEGFKEVEPTGVIFTKTDGDGKGGAILSIKYITNLPIRFLGIGEKVNDIEGFNPKQIVDRILGKGDIVALVEKFSEIDSSEEEVEKLSKRIKKGLYNLEDFKNQLKQINKLGNITSLMGMIPGMGAIKDKLKDSNIDDSIVKRQIALINSMTKKERSNPDVLNFSRKKRVVSGAGQTLQDLNRLLKQFEQTKKLVKQFSSGGSIKNLTDLLKLGK